MQESFLYKWSILLLLTFFLLALTMTPTYKPITKIFNCQLDIKVRQFTEKELDILLTKLKSRKVAGCNEILPEVWKTKKFDDLLL